MPSFLKEIRRFSRSTSKSKGADSTHSSQGSPSNQSSSTINTGPGSSSPPSTIPSEQSSSHIPSTSLPTDANGAFPVPSRPAPSAQYRYSRNSLASTSGSNLVALAGSPSSQRQPQPTSQFAPRVLSITENSWVYQKILLIYGQISDPAIHSFDGQVWVCHHQDTFPATSWPVCDSHFKALVHLQPGPNRIRLDFVSPKLQGSTGPNAHSSWININYLPLVSAPPLDLAILVAKDSPETFDAVPERIAREGNNLQTAVRKFKMAAYLWQAFTGEQMNRNTFGRRCFRFEEEWQQGTLTARDSETLQMRNEAKIHIIRTDKTVAEMRDLDLAQQHGPATRKGELFDIAMNAVKSYFRLAPGQTRYVSVLLLDTHWDPKIKVVRGHAALGGGDDAVKLAIFGSHALQSYPSCLEEVVPAFTDCTRTDTAFVANDCNESGSNFEAANIGIGAHMHETGHLFGCPHQENGVMLRDYVTLNRTFICREPFSTRTKSQGLRLCLAADECTWHRLDTLRFRFHPCFRLPPDVPSIGEDSVQVWAVDNGSVMVTAAAGVAWIEIFAEGDDVCKSHIEYLDTPSPPRQVMLTEGDLRSRLPADKQKKKLRIEIFSAGQGKHVVEDFGQLVSKSARIKLSNGHPAFRGGKLGFSNMEGSRAQEVLLSSVTDSKKLLKSIRVYHGFALDGMEFMYEDGSTQLFGKRGGKQGGSEFSFDVRRGEVLVGFYVRAGVWIDGVQILTSLGRKSEIYGNAVGGSGHTLIPPRGYSIAGISGSVAQWVDGFSLVITR